MHHLDPIAEPRSGWRAGLLAAGPALLILVAGRALLGPGLLEQVASGVTRFVPLPLFGAALDALGPLAKGLLSLVVAAGALGLGAIGGALVARIRLAERAGFWATAILVAFVAWDLGAVVLPLLVGEPPMGIGSADPRTLLLPLTTAAAVYGLVLAGLLRAEPSALAGATGEGTDADAGSPRLPRRSFLGRSLRLVGGISLAVAGVGLLGRVAGAVRLPTLGAPAQRATLVDAFGVTPAVTPVADFYVVGISVGAPQVDLATWSLSVEGLVDRPRRFTLDDLRGFERVEGYRTLQCISNPVVEYGPYIGNQRWAGVRLRDVLDGVGVRSDARFVLWRAADGYTESLPLEVALDERTWLVDEMGPAGSRLTPEHGFPLRVLIAGRYGMKQPKHLTAIVLSAEEEYGYWVQRGWDPQAVVRTMSRIDLPKDGDVVPADAPLAVYGIASAGDRGIVRVEVSADGGASWQDAELQALGAGGPIGELTWRRWRATLPAPSPTGRVLALRVRATDGEGNLQAEDPQPPLPSGATGWHRVSVTVG